MIEKMMLDSAIVLAKIIVTNDSTFRVEVRKSSYGIGASYAATGDGSTVLAAFESAFDKLETTVSKAEIAC